MNRATYDQALHALCELFHEMILDAELDPKKWDEEYSEHAVADCIDRLLCATPLIRPTDEQRNRFRRLVRLAHPYLDEGVPLPGKRETFTLSQEQLVLSARVTRSVGGMDSESYKRVWRRFGMEMGFDPETVEWDDEASKDEPKFSAVGARIAPWIEEEQRG